MRTRIELHEKQSRAFESEATELLYGGAAGGGKSHLIRAAAIAWCHVIPGLQFYLFRRTFDDLYKNHMEGPTGFPALLAEWIESGYARINLGKNFISIGDVSKIHLCHCQYEHDVLKYQGAEIHVLAPDELTHFTQSQYRFLRSRVRLGGLQIPEPFKGRFPRILAATNPGGIGHNWVKAGWVDAAAEGDIWQAPARDGGMRRQYIRALLEDNPTLTENDPYYEQKLEGMGDPALVRAMRLGDWDIVSGGMFDDVWDRAIHVVKPFPIPRGWYIDRSFDWGSSKPFSVGWWAESDGNPFEMAPGVRRVWPRGTLVRIGEWYGWNGEPNKGLKMTARDIARGIMERETAMGIAGRVESGPADPAIFTDEDAHCIASEFANAAFPEFEGRTVEWSKGVRIRDRKQGWQIMRELLKAARVYPMEAPGLFVFETCTDGFIRTVPVLSRDPRDSDDVDTKSEDHAGDEARYRCVAERASGGGEAVAALGL